MTLKKIILYSQKVSGKSNTFDLASISGFKGVLVAYRLNLTCLRNLQQVIAWLKCLTRQETLLSYELVLVSYTILIVVNQFIYLINIKKA